MDLANFKFTYPESLIATEKTQPSRVMLVDKKKSVSELTKEQLLDKLNPNDVLVINDTKVEKRRIHCANGVEVLFIQEVKPNIWQVLYPSRRVKKNQAVELPGGVQFNLIEKGIPQLVEVSKKMDQNYFSEFGQMALPPYIQKQRNKRENNENDELSYQTDWAKTTGSCAAPTASLHFNNKDLDILKSKGVEVCRITLHVGLGTFLPIRTDNILDHQMHKEEVHISQETLIKLKKARSEKRNIWTLGTTATRAVESIDKDIFKFNSAGDLIGETDLFLYPGKSFDYVTRLMTNFHQPGSTLVALVAAFAGLDNVKSSYAWAIENQFKLFSYGDLSVWEK